MSIITLPATVIATAGGQTYGQVRYDSEDSSPATGQAFTSVYGPPRWRMSLSSKQALKLTDAGEWEAMALKLRGGINHLALYDLLRSSPQGTLRSDLTLASTVAIGATTMVVENAIGGLVPGDWLQIGTGVGTSQLVKTVETVNSSVSNADPLLWDNTGTFTWTNGATFIWTRAGAQMTITFEPPSRYSFSPTTVVTWNKPLSYYKLTNSSITWAARANGPAIDGFAFDLLEQW